jgi:hypothetical protein
LIGTDKNSIAPPGAGLIRVDPRRAAVRTGVPFNADFRGPEIS